MEQSAHARAERAAATAASADIWTLSDGRAGNVRQVQALALALAIGPAQPWALQAKAPWRWLAPRRWPGAEAAFGEKFAAALARAPSLAIGCGRQAALATRLLGRRGAQTVQILDPGMDPAHWDLVIAPEHDRLRGDNVICLLGSLHPIDEHWLAHARAQFVAIERLPEPRTTVLIGGPSRNGVFDHIALDGLMTLLDLVLARDGGSLLLTASRRTPPSLREALRSRYNDTPGLLWLDAGSVSTELGNDGGNPYPGMLAWADRIVCTPDSVNMISEACATQAPVFVFEPVRAGGRIGRFLAALEQRGRIRSLDARLKPFAVEPLRETARVATEVRERLNLSDK